MKAILTFFIVTLLAFKASAQYGMPAKDAVKRLNDTVQVWDVVTNYKQSLDSVFLEVGKGSKRNRIVLVLTDRGKSDSHPLSSGYPIKFDISFTGVVRLYKGRPTVFLNKIYNDVITVH